MPRVRKKGEDLMRDAVMLFDAATAFIRIYQFRDRDSSLRHGLTVAQAYTLDLLVRTGGMSLTGLAKQLYLDKSTTSRIVAGMAKRHLIRVSRPSHDGRGRWIETSTEGRRRYERLRRGLVRDNARFLASCSKAVRRAIVTSLQRLAARGCEGVRQQPPSAAPSAPLKETSARGRMYSDRS
jgi:DNA-binding MarR family transcriptional regulator